MLLNLCRNGMQAMNTEFMEGGGPTSPALPQVERVLQLRVRPALAANGRWVEFSVTDSGLGISEEVAQQLFTPFFTTKEEGMGMGLSLCRTVVEQHGSALVFAPTQPQGTVFTFTLPGASSGIAPTVALADAPEPA